MKLYSVTLKLGLASSLAFSALACAPVTQEGGEEDIGETTPATDDEADESSEVTSDDGPATTTDESESETESESESESSEGETWSDEVTDAADDEAPPVGCTDNIPDFFAKVIDGNTIRLSSLPYECDESVSPDPNDLCDYDDYDALLTIPNLEPGTYSLADGVATLVVVEEWDHDQGPDGCFCVDEVIEQTPVLAGTVTVGPNDGLDDEFGVDFDDLDHPLFGGQWGFLVSSANCG